MDKPFTPKPIISNVDYYLLEDHAARRRTTLLGAGIGLVLGTLAQASGASISITAGVCFAAAGIVEITRAVTYKQPRRLGKAAVATSFSLRRQLIYVAFSAVGFLFLALLRIPRVEARTVERKLREAADNPANPQNIREATKIIATAKRTGIKINQNALTEVGNKFIEAGEENGGAWNAALALLNYRSFLNEDIASTGRPKEGQSWTISIPPENEQGVGKRDLFWAFLGWVPASEAAQLYMIGTSPNIGRDQGPEKIIVVATTPRQHLIIDGFFIKKTEFRDFTIIYNGGQVVMDHTLFVNCDFQIRRSRAGAELASQILSKPLVIFTNIDAQHQ